MNSKTKFEAPVLQTLFPASGGYPHFTPLCPVGHLPRPSRHRFAVHLRMREIENSDLRPNPRTKEWQQIQGFEEEWMAPQVISPLAGEMSDRTEGGIVAILKVKPDSNGLVPRMTTSQDCA